MLQRANILLAIAKDIWKEKNTLDFVALEEAVEASK